VIQRALLSTGNVRLEQLDWTVGPTDVVLSDADLVLLFAGSAVLARRDLFAEARARFPRAHVVGCSTAGEIMGTYVHSESVACTAIRFEKSRCSLAIAELPDPGRSYETGRALAAGLDPAGLVHALVISDGIGVNGTELVRGIVQGLPQGVTVSGGLAGDGARMAHTVVVADGRARPKIAAALGLYGSHLRVGHGCQGGWDPFGPERLITKAEGNVLYELDHGSALALYERYLGSHASGLPSTGLLFPLSVRAPGETRSVVRTILGVDRERQSIIFAGDVPGGHYARLMKANLDRLVDGAQGAAGEARRVAEAPPELAILVSCVGRRLVLDQRVEEEVEGVRDALGGCAITGFYSNGEISPTGVLGCELHNQTMTITTLAEVP
jgi:hypothetical protein